MRKKKNEIQLDGKKAIDRVKQSHYIAMACLGVDKPDTETVDAINQLELYVNFAEIVKEQQPDIYKFYMTLVKNYPLSELLGASKESKKKGKD